MATHVSLQKPLPTEGWRLRRRRGRGNFLLARLNYQKVRFHFAAALLCHETCAWHLVVSRGCPSSPRSCLQSAPASRWVEQPIATAKGNFAFHVGSRLVLGSWGPLLNSGSQILIGFPISGGNYEFINLISYYYSLMPTALDSCKYNLTFF